MSPGRRRHRWKALEMSHLESHNGPSEGSAYQIFYRNWGRHAPNCMALGEVDLLVDVLAVGVTSSGAVEELQIRRGFLLSWYMDARRDVRMRFPKTYSTASTGNSYFQKKAVASGVRVDACGPVAISAIIVFKGQAGPTVAG